MTNDQFIKYVITDCASKKINVIFTCNSNEDSTGSFQHNPPEIIVDMYREEKRWIMDLLHEYCHVQQWYENTKVFWDTYKYIGIFQDVPEEFDSQYVLRGLKAYQACEYDCEKRALKMIDDYSLPINKIEYIKLANAALIQYNLMATFGMKTPNCCEFDDFVKIMPQELTILTKLPKNISKKYKDLIDA